jgi:hypothetical protein
MCPAGPSSGCLFVMSNHHEGAALTRRVAPLCHSRLPLMEKTKMAQTEEKRKEVYPPAYFWQALLEIRNHYFERELMAKSQILESLQTLDCWLDVAIEEKWLED